MFNFFQCVKHIASLHSVKFRKLALILTQIYCYEICASYGNALIRETLETFRFEDENDYEYEICFGVLKLHFTTFFTPEKLALISLLKEVKPSLEGKIIKLLTFDNLFLTPLCNRPSGIRIYFITEFSEKMSAGWLPFHCVFSLLCISHKS